MTNTETLITIAEAACDAAISEGAEFADVSATSGRSLSVELESSAVKACDARLGSRISVRAIYRGGTGWSSVDRLSIDSAAEAGRSAARLAKLAEPDPDFLALPTPAPDYPTVEGLYDPVVERMDVKEIIRFALDNIDGAHAVAPDAIVSGGFSSGYSADALVNSLGVRLADEETYIGGHVMVVVKSGEEVGSFYDFDSARIRSDFVPEGIGASAAQQALKFLGARRIETGRMPVVLGPLSGRSIFSSIVAAADADGVQRGRSFMIGKVGQKIASDLVTITDNPLIPRGLGSRRNDSEGVPSRPLVIVENGVLKTYLFSSYTAGKAKVPPTGHGTRGGGAAASNVIPNLGTMTAEEIIRTTKSGLYINLGGISPNTTTGDVSTSVDFGFKIENGELAYPVASSLVGGKFLDMLANIDAISSDYREEPGMIMPTVRIQDVLVAGGK
ncbi:MAG: TldD/PmbA family protein [Armatimonadetes bacterium]|nr:TldD/PmbA family protein [Armatimonadota bacterium]